MINAIQAIPNYQTLTEQQIADALQATGITPRAIDLGELLFLLNNRGMLVRLIRPADSGEKWSGSLVNLINFCNDSESPLAPHVNQFFSHITNDRNKTFDTRQPDYAGLFLLIVSTFADQEHMPTMADFTAIAELGGGWIYSNVTASDVESAFSQAAIAESARQIHAEKQALKARLERITVEIKNRIDVGAITTTDGFSAVIDEVL